MFSLTRYLHLHEMAPESRRPAFRFFGINISRTFSFALADAFVILYLIATLNYARFGLLLSLRFILTSVLDYPTGALGDVIGQKKVLIIAYITRVISIFFLVISTEYWHILVYYMLDAVGSSQESGALESWFDNKYKLTSKDVDPKNAIFGAFQGKIGSLNFGIRAIAYLIGGYIASQYSRKLLFIVYLLGVLFVFLMILSYIESLDINDGKFSIKAYLSQLGSGLKFYVSKKSIFIYYFGFNFLFASISIWGLLILFPMYSAYSGSDAGLGILRSVLLLTGFVWFTVLARMSRKIETVYKPLFLSVLLGFPGLFFAGYLHYRFIPPQETVQVLSILTIILLFQIPGMTQPFINIFNSRINIEIVPNEIRNSIYSLIPTIVGIMSAGFTYYFGMYITENGMEQTILLLSIVSSIGVVFIGIGLLLLAKDHAESEIQSQIMQKEMESNISKYERELEIDTNEIEEDPLIISAKSD